MPQGYKADGTPANPTGKGGFGDRPWTINRGGLTKEQRAEHMRQHDVALRIRAKQMDALEELLDTLDDAPADIVASITPAINAMINDAMDRNGGKPKQSVDLSSDDGSMSPSGMGAFYGKLKEND